MFPTLCLFFTGCARNPICHLHYWAALPVSRAWTNFSSVVDILVWYSPIFFMVTFCWVWFSWRTSWDLWIEAIFCVWSWTHLMMDMMSVACWLRRRVMWSTLSDIFVEFRSIFWSLDTVDFMVSLRVLVSRWSSWKPGGRWDFWEWVGLSVWRRFDPRTWYACVVWPFSITPGVVVIAIRRLA